MKTLPNHFIFKEAELALKAGKSVFIRVVGGSMEPFLSDDKDVVKITPCIPTELRCGDVALFKSNASYCLHRVIAIKGDEITLCGDAIYQFCEVISSSEVIGVLHAVTHQSGKVVVCSSVTWRMQGKIWMFLFPIRKYLLYIHRKWRYVTDYLNRVL